MSPLELTMFFVKTFFIAGTLLAIAISGMLIADKVTVELRDGGSWRWRIAMLVYGLTVVALIITGIAWLIVTIGPPAAAQ